MNNRRALNVRKIAPNLRGLRAAADAATKKPIPPRDVAGGMGFKFMSQMQAN